MEAATPKPARLPFATKLLYGSGTIAFGVKDQGFAALLMLFYNQVVGLPAAWVGAAIMIAMVADALFDPLLGQVSDDFRSRWGRRHPFMYAAALPIAVSYLFLWMPPEGSDAAQFAYLVVVAIIVRFSISLYEIPSTALLAEFTSDYDERTRLVSYRFLFGVIGGVVMNILAFKYFLVPSAAHPVGQLNPAGYATYAIVASAIMLVSVMVSSLGTHKQIAALPPPVERQRPTLGELVREMGSVLLHPTYSSVLLASLFFAMSSGLTSSLNAYFWTFFWELDADHIAALTAAAFGGVILAFVVALPMATRFGKKATAMVMYGLSLIIAVTPLSLRLLGLFPDNGDPTLMTLLMIQIALFAMCTITASILAVSMIADVTEQVQLSTGRRSEGLLFSAATMVNKAVSGMGVFVSGLVLAAVHFPTNAQPGAVEQVVLSKLAIISMVASGTLSVIAITCLSFYPITRAHHTETLNRLGGRDD